MDLTSANTRFLYAHTPVLSSLFTLAELRADSEPEASIRHSRRYARAFVLYGLAHLGAYRPGSFDQSMRANIDELAGLVHIPNVYLLLRIIADGTHPGHAADAGGPQTAGEMCIIGHQLAVFYQRVFARQPDFSAERYHVPDPDAMSEEDKRELERATDAMYDHMDSKLVALAQLARGRGDRHMDALIHSTRRADIYVHVTESMVRRAVEQQLRAAGWTVTDEGEEPRASANLAIPTSTLDVASADYALFCDKKCVAVVACRRSHDSPVAALAHGRGVRGDAPLVFATAGHPFRSDHPDSGLWLWNARADQADARIVDTFYTPAGARALTAETAETEGVLWQPDLRAYQHRAVGTALAELYPGSPQARRTCLVAMAPGTGKTLVAAGIASGLRQRGLSQGRAFRVLYLVANETLAEQVGDALPDVATAGEAPVHIATVGDMHARVLDNDDPATIPPVDAYGAIIVDDCPEIDRRLLEHFDAQCVALTATPTAESIELFGEPVYHYRYDEAARAGHVIDAAPPVVIRPDQIAVSPHQLAPPSGQKFNETEQISARALYQLPDRIVSESTRTDSFARTVESYSFNRAACASLAADLDVGGPGKTLVYCVDHDHADMVTGLLREAIAAVRDDGTPLAESAVLTITSAAPDRRARLDRFRRDHRCVIAVTDDFLTTGIDLPAVTTLVFLRPVTSRWLYAQMLGRASRPCPDFAKRAVQIFDCVDDYQALVDAADMRPVVPWPRPGLALPEPAPTTAVTHQRATYDTDGRDARAYIDHVAETLSAARDDIPGLALVQRAPHDITRTQLDDMRAALEPLGITESRLQRAHSERSGEPVNVSLLGLLRHHLMHEILVENRARVQRALARMLANHDFNPVQKQALKRMAEQLQENLILEPNDLDQGALKAHYGGFHHLDEKRFGGDLAALLDEFERALWE